MMTTPERVSKLTQQYNKAISNNNFDNTMAAMNAALRAGLDMTHPIVVACIQSMMTRIEIQLGCRLRPDDGWRAVMALVKT